MENMWSPWRSNYIESFKDKKIEEGDSDCVFCNQVFDDIEKDNSIVVYHGDLCYITLNLYPYNGGHLMVIPKRHLSDFGQLNSNEMTEMMQLVQKSIAALKHVMKPHGFNLGANIGRAAGAGIDQHLHFHVLPRWNGDTNFMPALGEVKVVSQDLLRIKKNLIEAFEILESES